MRNILTLLRLLTRKVFRLISNKPANRCRKPRNRSALTVSFLMTHASNNVTQGNIKKGLNADAFRTEKSQWERRTPITVPTRSTAAYGEEVSVWLKLKWLVSPLRIPIKRPAAPATISVPPSCCAMSETGFRLALCNLNTTKLTIPKTSKP